MDDRCYYRLCAGIIERAVDDYRTSLRYLMHKKIVDNDWNLKEKHFKNRHHREAWNMKTDCERFFFSHYFDYLSDTEDFGPALVNKIREDVKNGN